MKERSDGGSYRTNNTRVEEPEAGLWIVSFNRPEVYNALNTDTSRDMKTIFGPLAFQPGDLRCVILTATGDKAFSAGGDLKQRKGMTDDEWRNSTPSSRKAPIR